MKTPDEIKKGLEYCHSAKPCIDCKYDQRDFPHCVRRLLADAIDGYEQLESRLAQVEQEMDAVADDARLSTMCDTCKHNNSKDYPNKPCYKCDEAFNYWEWRGVCAENTQEE